MSISIGRFSLGFLFGRFGLKLGRKAPSPPEAWWHLPPEVTIRIADEADAEAMRAVHAASYGAAYAWHPSVLRSAILDSAIEIGTCGSDPERPWHHLVAEIDGRVVGFIRSCCFSIRSDDAPAIFVAMLYVHPDVQRQGVGSELLALCARHHLGAGQIILNIATHAREAALFYRRHGFRPINRGTLTLAEGSLEVDVVYLTVDVAQLAVPLIAVDSII